MAEVLLFHHALGLTDGMRSFADSMRTAGHSVMTPDLFEGATFDSIADGVAHAEEVGFDTIAARGAAFADGLGDGLVVAGFSLGVMPAQQLAQTRPGVAGAILCYAAVPPSSFGDAWPSGVALQLHFNEHDEWAAEDYEVALELVTAAGAELFVYPVTGHLVVDPSSADHDPASAALVLERTLAFLGRLDAAR